MLALETLELSNVGGDRLPRSATIGLELSVNSLKVLFAGLIVGRVHNLPNEIKAIWSNMEQPSGPGSVGQGRHELPSLQLR